MLVAVILAAPAAYRWFTPDPLGPLVRHHQLDDGTEFLSTPKGCHDGQEGSEVLEVRETATTVTLAYHDRLGAYCPAVGCIGHVASGDVELSRLPPSHCDLSVRLDSPLGDRTVIDAATGGEIEALGPS